MIKLTNWNKKIGGLYCDNINKKTIVNANLGTIDYITGNIVLNSFNPTSFEGSKLQITANPESNDIIPLREQIVQISSSLLTVNINDISSIKSGSQTFTSSSTSSTSTSTTTSTTTSTSGTGY